MTMGVRAFHPKPRPSPLNQAQNMVQCVRFARQESVKMAQTAFSIRMDDGLKRDFSRFCENIGMTMSTAFVVFAKATLRERRIPFEISDSSEFAVPAERIPSRTEALRAFERIRAEVQSRGVPEMTMDEIDAEIAAARGERRRRKAAGFAAAGTR